MSTQSYNHRDTPLRRFNTFWWGLAYFGLFGIVSVVVVALSDRSPGVEELLKEDRLKSKEIVDAKQADLLTEKELEPGQTKQVPPHEVFDRVGGNLKKSPVRFANAKIGDPVKGGKLFPAKSCATCHGADGNKPISPIYPKLGGKEAGYLAKRMKDIKSGAYTTTYTPQMKPFIDKVSDEEINDIAQWLADGSK